MGEEDAADPFDLLQPIPAKPKPAAVPDSEPKASSPGSGNGAVPMGPGANAQRDAMRDAIANKMDEMLDARLELYTGQILDALKAMNARLDVLETAVRGGTATLRKETRELRDDVAALDEKIARAEGPRTSLLSESADAEVDEEATPTADLTPTAKPKSALASVPSALPTARLAEPAVDRGRGPGPEAGAAAASAPPPEAEPAAPVAPPVASPQTQTQWAQPQRGASQNATEGSPYGAAPGGGPPPYGAPGQALGSPAYASYQPQRSPGPGPPPPPDRGYPPYPRHYPPPPGGAGAGGGPPHHGGGPPPHHGPPGVPFHPHGGPPPGAPYGPPFPGAGPRAGPASIETRNVKVSMDKIVEDFANMGFTRDQIVGVIRELQDSGQGVDLNVVLDRLMNPRR